jgi:hypothetical protein
MCSGRMRIDEHFGMQLKYMLSANVGLVRLN